MPNSISDKLKIKQGYNLLTVHAPADFAVILRKHKKESVFFNTLSFTNKKEYIEWIVSAKREETRNDRLKGSIEKLGKGWKNPSNI